MKILAVIGDDTIYQYAVEGIEKKFLGLNTLRIRKIDMLGEQFHILIGIDGGGGTMWADLIQKGD